MYAGRRPRGPAFDVHQLARHVQPPHGRSQAVQSRAIGLMHAVAEQQLAFDQGRRADDRELQLRRRSLDQAIRYAVAGSTVSASAAASNMPRPET